MLVNVQLPPGATQERTLRRDAAGRGLHAQAARGAEHGRRAGLQLLGPGPERGAGLRDAQGLGRAHRRRAVARRRWPAAPSARSERHPRCVHLPAEPAADSRAGRLLRLQPSACRTAPAWAATRCWPRATSCWAWRRRASCSRRCAPTGWKTRRSCSSTSTATRPTRWAWASTPSTPPSPPRWARAYVNDFPNAGRLQRVVVQADAPARMQPEDLLRLSVPNSKGQAVPLSAFATTRWITGPMQTVRYNGYPSMRISGSAAPGVSTGAGHGRDGAAGGASCRRASASSGPASRARKSSPARRP